MIIMVMLKTVFAT